MALFGNNGNREQETAQKASVTNETPKQEEKVDADFLSQYAGKGLENFDSETTSRAYLAMVQPGSTAAVDYGEPVGTWRNTATQENYGPVVEVVVVGFAPVWTERSSEPPYNTVAQYAPNSIEVRVEPPKPGTKGFGKMFNKDSGNKIESLFVYALILKDNPEGGVVIFSPTSGSMRTCKTWNSMIKNSRLSDGSLAPIFGYSWKLVLESYPDNPKQGKKAHTALVSVERGELISKPLFSQSVQPQLKAAGNLLELAAPENND
jgi:hypothetical protein